MAKYRKYSKEFQLQAAKLVTEQGYSYDKAAKQLGTTGWSVRNWVQKFQQTGDLPSRNESQPKIDEILNREPPTHGFSDRWSGFNPSIYK
ncbi:MAG: transposase [Planctomycetota bacterium]|jgi:transposase-like protein